MYVCKKGDKGDAVKTLQKRLRTMGAKGANGKPLAVDGDYGPATASALTAIMGWTRNGFVNGPRCVQIEDKRTAQQARKIVLAQIAKHAKTPHGGAAGDHTHTFTVEVS